jgi:hypothetical protein
MNAASRVQNIALRVNRSSEGRLWGRHAVEKAAGAMGVNRAAGVNSAVAWAERSSSSC